MNLKTQTRIAAKVLKCSPKKVVFDSSSLVDIKEAITRADIKNLVSSKVIVKSKEAHASRGNARIAHAQRKKGRRSGQGSRKGRFGARVRSKETWMIKVRLQRSFAQELKERGNVSKETFRDLYSKIKGGYFRNKRHIKLYLEESELFIKGAK
jgi:large subunit ribosomal protein L19e